MRPVGAELFHVGGRTDGLEEASSCFSEFCERAKKQNQNRNWWMYQVFVSDLFLYMPVFSVITFEALNSSLYKRLLFAGK